VFPLGKISKALAKYASERKQETRVPPAVPQLTAHDIEVLVAYDRETGCLLKGDSRSGQVDGCRIEELRESGTIQRLLENQLIHPTGNSRAGRGRPAGWPAWRAQRHCAPHPATGGAGGARQAACRNGAGRGRRYHGGSGPECCRHPRPTR
jgi:hypothetical protein